MECDNKYGTIEILWQGANIISCTNYKPKIFDDPIHGGALSTRFLKVDLS